MGANTSNTNVFKNLSSNEYLVQLSGPDYISPNDPFWNQLLSFTITFPKNSSDQRHLEELTLNLCKNFTINNCRTGNFGSLIRVFLIRASELSTSALCKDDMFTWQACNALFIIRICCKYFVENLTEEVMIQQFETINHIEGNSLFTVGSLKDDFLDRLVSVLVDVPVEDVTYVIHCEAINIILTLLSVQLFQSSPIIDSLFYNCMMQGKCSNSSRKLVRVLLNNFILQRQCSVNQHGTLYGITTAVASGLWTVVTLGMSGQKSDKENSDSEPSLANQSLLLLLVLCNHFYSDATFANPYQKAFLSLTDGNQEQSNDGDHVTISFSSLFSTMCRTLKSHHCTLLLYMFLHRVEKIRTYCLTRTNIDQLVLPLMEILYNTQERNSQHLYMSLIIILILSEDNNFSLAVHDIMLKSVDWFQERQIGEISLGGLMILVLIRTIQYNMTRMRDQYLHTNCLGALANMSSQFMNLHPYVAQRLVSLFALLLKKHKKISERLQNAISLQQSNHIALDMKAANGGPEQDQSVVALFEEDGEQELAIIEEVIRMTLEILNSCLCHSLNYNPHLVYSMLYQKELFEQLANHQNFQDVVFNIQLILNHFTGCLEKHSGHLGVAGVQEVIKQSGLQFRKDRLKKFPELKFRYVEEERPEEFFIPYVWTIVCNSSRIYFNPSRIRLFPM